MEKYYNEDGKVAVLYSPGYGAGWYTWNSDYPELIFDPDVVKLVLEGKNEFIENLVCENKYIGKYIYCGGARDLIIKWLDPGTQFKINEYDGSESLDIIGITKYHTA